MKYSLVIYHIIVSIVISLIFADIDVNKIDHTIDSFGNSQRENKDIDKYYHNGNYFDYSKEVLNKLYDIRDNLPSNNVLTSDEVMTATGVSNQTLSTPCLNSYCDFLVTALSCKVFTIHLKKVCAQYFLGAILGCPQFPPKEDIYNAPFFCTVQIGDLLKSLNIQSQIANIKGATAINDPEIINLSQQLNIPDKILFQKQLVYLITKNIYENEPNLFIQETELQQYRQLASIPFNISDLQLNFTIVKTYLESNMASNCQRRCYQTYLSQSNNLFGGLSQCHDEVYDPGVISNYPFLGLLGTYTELRYQVCATNPAPTDLTIPSNCYDTLTYLQSFTGSNSGGSIQDTLLYNMSCDYQNILGIPNSAIQLQIGKSIENIGCCFSNVMTLVQQNPNPTSGVATFPPCLLRYLHINYPSISPNKFCTYYANGNLTSFNFTLSITSNTGAALPPINVYNQLSLLTFYTLITTVLNQSATINAALPKYTFVVDRPLDVELVNFNYYSYNIISKSYTLLSSTDGSTPTGETDYKKSNSITATFLIILPGLTESSQIDAVSSYLTSALFATTISQSISGYYKVLYTTTVKIDNTLSAGSLYPNFVNQFDANPVNITSLTGASYQLKKFHMTVLISILLSSTVLLWHMI